MEINHFLKVLKKKHLCFNALKNHPYTSEFHWTDIRQDSLKIVVLVWFSLIKIKIIELFIRKIIGETQWFNVCIASLDSDLCLRTILLQSAKRYRTVKKKGKFKNKNWSTNGLMVALNAKMVSLGWQLGIITIPDSQLTLIDVYQIKMISTVLHIPKFMKTDKDASFARTVLIWTEMESVRISVLLCVMLENPFTIIKIIKRII